MNKISYNIVTSLLAGALVFAGAFTDGSISLVGVIAAISASLIVGLNKFRDYWSQYESSISTCFNFI